VLLAALLLVLGFVLMVGPWPLYSDSHFQKAGYYKKALAAIDAATENSHHPRNAGPLRAGWAEREITPKPRYPMAGYGTRPNNKLSTGVLEPLYVRTLALSDGTNTVVFVGSDMLQTLPNLLALVEVRISKTVSLTNRNIMYSSSHTHSGPGGLAPGMAAKESYGDYHPEYLAFLADRFAEAIEEAVKTLTPARFAHGSVDVPEYIRNRTRRAPVDSTLNIAVAEKIEGGQRLYIARYSAHGTAYGEEMLQLNNDWAGAFQRAVKDKTDSTLLYMGGAVGSMCPNPLVPPMPKPWTPELEKVFENDVESEMVKQGKKTLDELLRDQHARVEAMGAAMAERLVAAVKALKFEEHVGVASVECFYTPPPAQVRMFSPKWRLSPFAFKLLGVPTTGRLQAARIGSMFLIGMPYDLSGEISMAWQQWARERGADLWVTSFSGAYLGYLSPDKYYHEIGEDLHYNQNYEIGQMNWFGPNQEAYVTDLFHHVFERMREDTPS
jgi:hypothetical protein